MNHCPEYTARYVRQMPDRPEIITVGHSPDPDDAFMFYAIAQNKIDLRGYRFEHQLQDIQTLNERALRGELHISAISIHAYPYVADKYALLPCGASMGDGYGPIVIGQIGNPKSRIRNADAEKIRERLRDQVIAVPGKMTSAFLALRLYLGEFKSVVVPFDEIFNAVKTGRADAGLIIHEGQLTYERSGFTKMVDLGEWWKRATRLPLPLGGNVLLKELGSEVRRDVLAIMRESIDFGLTHRDEAVRYAMPYARDMDTMLASKFIGMYVNDFTRDYGQTGREAIRRFLSDGRTAGYIKKDFQIEFVS